MNKSFWVGVVVGAGGWWVWHAFVKPMPSTKG